MLQQIIASFSSSLPSSFFEALRRERDLRLVFQPYFNVEESFAASRRSTYAAGHLNTRAAVPCIIICTSAAGR